MPTTIAQQKQHSYSHSHTHSHSHKQTKQTTSPQSLHIYHTSVAQAMHHQMTNPNTSRHHNSRRTDSPLPLAKKPTPHHSTSTHSAIKPPPTSNLSLHVQEEMARRAKADRVLQDLSSDKSRQQARARETQRRGKWAKSIALVCPPEEVPVLKRQIAICAAHQGHGVGSARGIQVN